MIELHVQLDLPWSWSNIPWQKLWTVVQWQDGLGEWHDVEGWQSTLEADGTKTWWLGRSDFSEEPFRWLVYQHRAGLLLAASEPFYLPTMAGETVIVNVLLSPSQPADTTGTIPADVIESIKIDFGHWLGNIYTAYIAGTWTIRATYDGHTADIVLSVKPGELGYIVISSDTAVIAAGETLAHTAEAFDAYDNSLGDVTADTVFSIVESGHGGTWSANRYTTHRADTWTVRGTYKDLVANANLTVEPGELSYIVISSDTAVIAAGETLAYTAEAFDAYDNSLGNVTADTVFSIIESGHSGTWSANRYTARKADTWTVRGTYKDLVANADLTVEPTRLSYIVISSDTAVVVAGNEQIYIVKAFDAYDNLLGDVTADTVFSIVESGHGGAWSANRYTAHIADTWTVRGYYNGHAATVDLTVKPAESSYIVVFPDGVSVTAGNEQVYAAEAFDAYDNLLGDVTADTVFSIVESGHNGHWTDEIYAAHTAGIWTVRGFYGDTTDDAKLIVDPGELSYIVVTANTVTVGAGEQVIFTAEAFDAYDNSLGDVTQDTSFKVIDR